VHVASSDWYRHNHHKDEAYKNVILQVVYENDKPLKRPNGEPIPVVKLNFDSTLYRNYLELVNNKKWIACENRLRDVNDFIVSSYLQSLLIERLVEKSELIRRDLALNNNNWAETFYIYLAKNFGFRVNADAFEMLARSVPLKYLQRHKNNLHQIEAILFGQAGFLEETAADNYHEMLKKEYSFFKAKFDLKPLGNYMFKFLRLRPGNFPTIRIAQLASLLFSTSFLFSTVIGTETVSGLEACFNIAASGYWDDHYRFGKTFRNCAKKNLGRESFINIIINTVAPFLFLYGQANGSQEHKDRALQFLQDLPPERNAIVREWKKRGTTPENAFQSQALLQLKNAYCSRHRCIYCQIGSKIISTVN